MRFAKTGASPLRTETVGGLLLATLLGAAACAPAVPAIRTPYTAPPEPRLPPIPSVTGDLELYVGYPRDSIFIPVRDTTFIFGSTGRGDATLRINGRPVEVQPNGAFLAFLPIPQDGVWRLEAEAAGRRDTLTRVVVLPDPPPEPVDSAVILPGSAYPVGPWAALPGEAIELGFRGTSGGTAALVLPDGERIPLVEARAELEGARRDFDVDPGLERDRALAGWSEYRGVFTPRRLFTFDPAVPWPSLTGEPEPAARTLYRPLADTSAPADTVVPLDTIVRLDTVPAPEPAAEAPDTMAPADTVIRFVAPPAFREWLRAAPADRAAVDAPRGRVLEHVPVERGDTIVQYVTVVPDDSTAYLELVARGDTAWQPLRVTMLVMDPARPRVASAWDLEPPERNGDREIIARPGPGPSGPYDWFWINGTEMALDGQRGGTYRVDLDEALHPWVDTADVVLGPIGVPAPADRVELVRLNPRSDRVDVHVGVDRPLPYRVEQGDGWIRLLVYGAGSRVSFLQHGGVDPLIERAEWDQPTDRVFRLTVHTTRRPWGYDVSRAANGDLVLSIRRPPTIDRGSPLRGIRVAVDAGHGGAHNATVGPTGLTEADANLAIATRLGELLQQAGADVVMIRDRDSTVQLMERTHRAEIEDAHILVSVHNNAFPDGVNPWENNGTSVYYFHPWSAELAWSLHRELLDELGLRDLGVGRANLALTRPTWMPAALTETMFMMLPRQEAALRDPSVQRRIAEAHVRGLARFLTAVSRP